MQALVEAIEQHNKCDAKLLLAATRSLRMIISQSDPARVHVSCKKCTAHSSAQHFVAAAARPSAHAFEALLHNNGNGNDALLENVALVSFFSMPQSCC